MDSIYVKHILNHLCFQTPEMQVLGPLSKWALTNKSKGPSTQTKSLWTLRIKVDIHTIILWRTCRSLLRYLLKDLKIMFGPVLFNQIISNVSTKCINTKNSDKIFTFIMWVDHIYNYQSSCPVLDLITDIFKYIIHNINPLLYNTLTQ